MKKELEADRPKYLRDLISRINELDALSSEIGGVYDKYGVNMRFMRNPKLWPNCYVHPGSRSEQEASFISQVYCGIDEYIKLLRDCLGAHKALRGEFNLAIKLNKYLKENEEIRQIT